MGPSVRTARSGNCGSWPVRGLALQGAAPRKELADNSTLYSKRLENRDIVTDGRSACELGFCAWDTRGFSGTRRTRPYNLIKHQICRGDGADDGYKTGYSGQKRRAWIFVQALLTIL